MSAPAPPPPDVVALLTKAATHLTAAKYYDIASFTMMVYDIILTFPLEVEKIWSQKFTGVTVLWFLNRWWFLFAVIPTIAGFFDPRFIGKICEGYFRYPGIVAGIQRAIIGTVFMLRMYCIYGRSWKIAALVFVFLAAEVVTKISTTAAWGQAVTLPPGFVGCILSVAEENSMKFIVFWVLELATDTLVVVLTIIRSYQLRGSAAIWQSQLWQVLVKDGLIYFFIMFASNLTSVIFYVVLPEDLKAINANFGVMINSLMTARLILNLKTASKEPRSPQPHYGFDGARSVWEANIIGNIGNEFEGTTTGASSQPDTLVSSRRYSKAKRSETETDYELPMTPYGVVERYPLTDAGGSGWS
ncbi:hypothetical protein BXZ70DRAFT_906079 [Cristinia sonorae]|uniref:DUF6533 domain-containing protein n=1 Tax=Cristinia sonorae TaxID=1940300 RepID=A0A8K0UR50_9AGAR|nr:hypothetical protein BXZ70DRAFT_906079 [Cristinia sonorae]